MATMLITHKRLEELTDQHVINLCNKYRSKFLSEEKQKERAKLYLEGWTFEAIANKFNITILLMPIILFLIHVYYGVGTLVGLIKGFSWKKEYYSSKFVA